MFYSETFSQDDRYHPRKDTKRPLGEINAPPDNWEELGLEELQRALNIQPKEKRAKNVILFVGDGLGVSTLTAARWLNHERKQGSMQDARFGFENFDHLGAAMVRL